MERTPNGHIYYNDLSVRIVKNGVIIHQNGGYEKVGDEFVFTSPIELADWMREWYTEYLSRS